MGRPTDWSPLASSDPVPGDPEQVATLAGQLRQTAQKISDQVTALRGLCTDEYWDSDAGLVFRDKAHETADNLDKALARYQQASRAIDGYHPDLTEAQRLSLQALAAAQDANRRHQTATTALAAAKPDDPNHATLVQRQSTAADDLADARRTLTRATDLRDQAAHRAAQAIQNVITGDGLKDSGWDKFKHWVDDNASWIEKIGNIASWVATVCGGLALICSFIPVIGDAVAAVLGTIALIATAVALVAHLTLALAGDGSWLDVGLDAFALVTFGVGRVAASGTKLAAEGAEAAAKNARVEEIVAAKLATRDGFVGGKSLARITKAARQVAAKDFPELSWRAADSALKDAPKNLWPGWGRVAEGFSPKSIFSETVDAGKTIFNTDNLVKVGQTLRSDGVHLADFDPLPGEAGDALSKLGHVSGNLLGKPAVSALSGTANAFRTTFYVNTGAATVVDGLNHTPLFDPIKKLTGG